MRSSSKSSGDSSPERPWQFLSLLLVGVLLFSVNMQSTTISKLHQQINDLELEIGRAQGLVKNLRESHTPISSTQSDLARCKQELSQVETSMKTSISKTKDVLAKLQSVEVTDLPPEVQRHSNSDQSIISSMKQQQTASTMVDGGMGSIQQHGFVHQDESINPWLVIGIPTKARILPDGRELDYLRNTLRALFAQISSGPLVGKVKILVAKIDSHSKHTVYDECKKEFESNPSLVARSFVFTENDITVHDPLASTLINEKPSPNVPDRRVRKQTRDVVGLLRKTLSYFSPDHYLFMEDDFELCDHGMLALTHIIERASLLNGDWIAIKMSFGLNGIVIKGKDVAAFATYLEQNQTRRPPDHLIVEWFAGETKETAAYRGDRVHVRYKFNLFEHKGVHSSIRDSKTQTYPKCWAILRPPTVFEVEAYQRMDCPHEDLSPCGFAAGDCKIGGRISDGNVPCLFGASPYTSKPNTIHWDDMRVVKRPVF